MTPIVLALVLAAGPPAPSSRMQTLTVQVTEVAGGVAFVKPGEKAGLTVGAVVRFGDRDFKVVDVTAETASVAMPDRGALSAGSAGQASVHPPDARAGKGRTKIAASGNPSAIWNTPVRPATGQVPKRVPLSAASARATGPWNAMLVGRAASLQPVGSSGKPSYLSELQAIGGAQIAAGLPLAADADVSLLGWGGGGLAPAGAGSRPSTRVRELAVRWGDRFDPFFAAGRLRQAAWMIGTLDGARARFPVGGFGIGAFGGYVPDPENGAQSNEASRFGVELTWRPSDQEWKPSFDVVAHASQYRGKSDERRVTASTSLAGGPARMFAYGEVSAFDKQNPWNAPPMDVTAAGADASVRAGAFRFGTRADMRTPERSLWMQAHFPASWLCNANPEPCAYADERRWLGTADAQWTTTRVALSVEGMLLSYGAAPASAQERGVYADLRTLGMAHGGRVTAGGHVAQGTLVDQYGGYVGYGRLFSKDRVDFSLTWRPTMYSYRAFPASPALSNRFEAELAASLGGGFDVGGMVDVNTGDTSSTMFLFTTTWRP